MGILGDNQVILSKLDLIELTGRIRWNSQARELTAMGVPYRRRSDGSIVVLREDLGHATKEKGSASPRLRLSAG